MFPSIAKALKGLVPSLQVIFPGFFTALEQFHACHVGDFAHANWTQIRWLPYILSYASSTLHETCIVDAVTYAKTVAQFMSYSSSEAGKPQALQRLWCVFSLD
jgi:hypothetical protein